MEEKKTYLETQIDAVMTKDKHYTIIFQRAKLRMQHPLELQIVKEIDSYLLRDIDISEDEVKITITPPASCFPFPVVRKKSLLSRLRAAYQLVTKVKNHSRRRFILIVCPENLVFDHGLEPFFLHVGIKESLPPYEPDEARLLQEVKATVLALTDGQYQFEEYLKFHETLKYSAIAKEMLQAENLETLLSILERWMDEEEAKEQSSVHIPKRKWNVQRYIFFSIVALLIPAIIYMFYSVFFLQPKQKAYVQSAELFLQNKYSDVITALENYPPEKMPYVVQYELASSYVMTESLTEEQRKVVLNNITLKTDPQYLLYWIYIGRGRSEEAIELARAMEDRELIVYGLLKHREEIKADEKLSGEEKKQKLEEIDREIEEYKREREEQEQQSEEEEKQEEPNQQQPPAQQPAATPPASTAPNQQQSTTPAPNHTPPASNSVPPNNVETKQ
ncbi:type VII secretion protein EssB [Parageobacillus thermoglucosidasius]|uniref:Type VII secretion protein EssB n=1 Tax=Geobacillus sp. (strain Y4.1MC1) TaxID=581103 RepID=A0A7U4DJS1_GEOS0|nr:type VII secretion protein EssB [Parageobacillus thermoglucosidasius]MED4905416.1 type VII secretion protein EssB [Parageobacillus thermoglucosidasius]MED4913815.1 type VII secretion protein EssB [Parageobacillus thermoglucosidasius]MED4943794.1 type VII secretion protein EssB [Parageobacillus thermoglucosidasius]MED4983688.1 type VII secretion protein EssB [Parageobacillus thermoglucosidasius]RDE29556.1 type VII secretion protein EssB [Parageobacillus thermoglucosidasius]